MLSDPMACWGSGSSHSLVRLRAEPFFRSLIADHFASPFFSHALCSTVRPAGGAVGFVGGALRPDNFRWPRSEERSGVARTCRSEQRHMPVVRIDNRREGIAGIVELLDRGQAGFLFDRLPQRARPQVAAARAHAIISPCLLSENVPRSTSALALEAPRSSACGRPPT